jgi:glycosyltransferase 2 family protein
MLIGLWQMDREELLAGMLLFRLLYYLVPFVISVILLTFREVIISARSKRLRQAALSLDPGRLDPGRPAEAAYVRERGDPAG